MYLSDNRPRQVKKSFRICAKCTHSDNPALAQSNLCSPLIHSVVSNDSVIACSAWGVTSENVTSDVFPQHRFRSACALRILIRIFTGRILNSHECKVSCCGQRSLSRLRGSLGAHVSYYLLFAKARSILYMHTTFSAFTTLRANSSVHKLIFFSLFQKQDWHFMKIVSNKLSPLETIRMRCQNLFSWKIKNKTMEIFQYAVCWKIIQHAKR